MTEFEGGRGRPDSKEAKDQRDTRPRAPIDLVEYRRRKEEQEEDFLSPEDKRFLNGLREYINEGYMKYKESMGVDQALERTIAMIHETPLNFDDGKILLLRLSQKR
jgi:hypothetical protein